MGATSPMALITTSAGRQHYRSGRKAQVELKSSNTRLRLLDIFGASPRKSDKLKSCAIPCQRDDVEPRGLHWLSRYSAADLFTGSVLPMQRTHSHD